jgi:hypothetical protein
MQFEFCDIERRGGQNFVAVLQYWDKLNPATG